jgi:hypothetical protein
MNLAFRFLLAILICGGMLALQIIIMAIARFFERTAGQATYYQVYLIPISLTVISAVRYIMRIPNVERWPDFVGDPVANILMFIAGVFLFVLGNFLQEKMIGGRYHDGP